MNDKNTKRLHDRITYLSDINDTQRETIQRLQLQVSQLTRENKILKGDR